MVIIKNIYFIVLVLLLSSCSKTVSYIYSSEINPTIEVNYSDTITVTSKNNLSSKYYIDKVVSSLREKGFYNTYRFDDTPYKIGSEKFIVYFYIESESIGVNYDVPIYGQVSTGDTTTNCYNNGGRSISCTSTSNSNSGIVGYKNVNKSIIMNFLHMYWYISDSENPIFKFIASMDDINCTVGDETNILIKNTVDNINFNKRQELTYIIRVPDNYKCK